MATQTDKELKTQLLDEFDKLKTAAKNMGNLLTKIKYENPLQPRSPRDEAFLESASKERVELTEGAVSNALDAVEALLSNKDIPDAAIDDPMINDSVEMEGDDLLAELTGGVDQEKQIQQFRDDLEKEKDKARREMASKSPTESPRRIRESLSTIAGIKRDPRVASSPRKIKVLESVAQTFRKRLARATKKRPVTISETLARIDRKPQQHHFGGSMSDVGPSPFGSYYP